MSCRWISAPPQIFMDCRGYPEELPHHGLHHRLQGIPSLAPGAPPCPLTLGTAKLFLSHILTPLFSEHYYPHAVTFFSIHRYMITVVFLPSFLGPIFTSGGSILEHWFYQTWRKLLATSHRTHPCSPPTTKTWSHSCNTAPLVRSHTGNLPDRPLFELVLPVQISFNSL